MAEGIIGSVGVSVVPDAENFWRRFEAATSPGAARAGERLGSDVRHGMEVPLARPVEVKVKADAKGVKEATHEAHLLRDAIVFLGPATVPIAGVLTGAFAGAIPVVATLALGIKGIADEMKSGQLVGTQYGNDLAALGEEADKLQGIAAGGLLSGIDRALQTSGPLFSTVNDDIGVMSSQLGDIVAGAAPALLSIFTALNPLFVTFGQLLTTGAGQLEHWATSSTGIQSFVAYVQTELPVVAHAIGALVQFASHLVQALAPMGHVILSGIGLLAGVLDAIPVGVLRTLVPLAISTYAAFRAYAGINVLLQPVNAALVAHAATVAASSLTVQTAMRELDVSIAASAATAAQAKADEALDIAAANAAITESMGGTASLFQAEAISAGDAAAEIVASWNGVASLFATDSTLIAEASLAEAEAFQLAADAAIAAAAEIEAASTAAAETAVAEGEIAAGGWTAMLGPIGAVVIGAGILGATLLSSSGDTQKATAATNDYVTALVASKGALDDNVRASIASRLATDGLIQAGGKLGLTTDTLVNATLGNAAAQAKVKAALQAAAPDLKHATDGHGNLKRSFVESTEQVGKLARGLHLEGVAFDSATGKAKAQRDAIIAATASTKDQATAAAALFGITGETGVDAYLAATQAAKKNTEQARKQTIQWQLENDAGNILATTLDKLSGKKVSFAQANNQFQQQLLTAVPQTGGTVDTSTAQGKLTAATEAAEIAQKKYNQAVAKGTSAQIEAAHLRLVRAQNAVASATKGLTAAQVKNAKAAAADSTSISGMSAAAVQNRGNLISLIQSAEQAAEAYGNVHKSGEAGRKKLIELRQAIIDNAVAHGEDKRAVTRYIDSLLKIPKSVPPTKFEVDTAAAEAKIKAFQRHVSHLHGKTVIINARVPTAGGGFRVVGGAGVQGQAVGGPVLGRGPKGVDSELRRLAPGEWVINDKAVDKFGPGFFAALNAGIMPAAPTPSASAASGGRRPDGRPVVVNQTFNSVQPTGADRLGPAQMRRAASDLARQA